MSLPKETVGNFLVLKSEVWLSFVSYFVLLVRVFGLEDPSNLILTFV